jgi:hypothetical protein
MEPWIKISVFKKAVLAKNNPFPEILALEYTFRTETSVKIS